MMTGGKNSVAICVTLSLKNQEVLGEMLIQASLWQNVERTGGLGEAAPYAGKLYVLDGVLNCDPEAYCAKDI